MTPVLSPRSLLGLVLWQTLALSAGTVGALGSAHAGEFYQQLQRPAWAPPGWLFGPVWTLLYLLMGLAAWRVWREKGFRGAKAALALFIGQLGVNALWSWVFFAWQSGLWATINIVVLLALIVVTMRQFARVHRGSAWLLAPYAAWVSFATLLCVSIWQRNPGLLG